MSAVRVSILLMSERTTDPLAEWGHGFDYRKWLYIGSAIASAIIVATLLTSMAVTASTFLCGQSCHAVNPQYQSWKRSSHAEVPCYRCHVGSSPIAWMRHVVITQPTNAYDWFTQNDPLPLNPANGTAALIPSDRCTGCHEDASNSKTMSGVPKRHTKHAAAGVTCVQCHNRIAHKRAERYQPLKNEVPSFRYADYLTMRSGCWRCHSTSASYRDDRLLDELGLAKFPATGCDSCHTGTAPPPASGPLDHTTTGWGQKRHGRIAAKDYGECLVCHPRQTANSETSDCTGCHNNITMPHNIGDGERFYASETGVPKWAREHAGFDESLERCGQCHQAKRAGDPCAQCHHDRYLESDESTTTTWPQIHSIASGEVGESCQECHMTEFCAYCHSNQKKPPRELYFNRLRRP